MTLSDKKDAASHLTESQMLIAGNFLPLKLIQDMSLDGQLVLSEDFFNDLSAACNIELSQDGRRRLTRLF